MNQNQYSRNDQNLNNDNRYRHSHKQIDPQRSGSNAYPNYGTHYLSGHQSSQRNDRPGYYTTGYQANNAQ